MLTALVSGLVAAVVSIVFNALLNYKTLKESCREILSDLRHEKQWAGAWTNEGVIDKDENETFAELFLWSRDGMISGYMKGQDGMMYPCFSANTGFRKKATFEGYSFVSGKLIDYGRGTITLVKSNQLLLINDEGQEFNLFKISDNPEKDS